MAGTYPSDQCVCDRTAYLVRLYGAALRRGTGVAIVRLRGTGSNVELIVTSSCWSRAVVSLSTHFYISFFYVCLLKIFIDVIKKFTTCLSF